MSIKNISLAPNEVLMGEGAMPLQNEFIKCCEHGELAKVKEFLKSGAYINSIDENGWTGLMWACQNGQTGIANFLLKNNADVNIKSDEGRTALMCACLHGNVREVKALIARNVDLNASDKSGDTALMNASWNGMKTIAQILLDAGADISAKDNDGNTALKIAKQSYNETGTETAWERARGIEIQKTIDFLEEYTFNNKTAMLNTESTIFSI